MSLYHDDILIINLTDLENSEIGRREHIEAINDLKVVNTRLCEMVDCTSDDATVLCPDQCKKGMCKFLVYYIRKSNIIPNISL